MLGAILGSPQCVGVMCNKGFVVLAATSTLCTIGTDVMPLQWLAHGFLINVVVYLLSISCKQVTLVLFPIFFSLFPFVPLLCPPLHSLTVISYSHGCVAFVWLCCLIFVAVLLLYVVPPPPTRIHASSPPFNCSLTEAFKPLAPSPSGSLIFLMIHRIFWNSFCLIPSFNNAVYFGSSF